jgi:hypothetical protein
MLLNYKTTYYIMDSLYWPLMMALSQLFSVKRVIVSVCACNGQNYHNPPQKHNSFTVHTVQEIHTTIASNSK